MAPMCPRSAMVQKEQFQLLHQPPSRKIMAPTLTVTTSKNRLSEVSKTRNNKTITETILVALACPKEAHK